MKMHCIVLEVKKKSLWNSIYIVMVWIQLECVPKSSYAGGLVLSVAMLTGSVAL
jgi:hypothetical protein